MYRSTGPAISAEATRDGWPASAPADIQPDNYTAGADGRPWNTRRSVILCFTCMRHEIIGWAKAICIGWQTAKPGA